MGTLNQDAYPFTINLMLGVDLGQKRDPTAIALLEARNHRPDDDVPDWHFESRFLQRLPLGTPYPAVARRIAQIQESAVLIARQEVADRHGIDPTINLQTFVDATGVGQPVMDLLNEASVRASACYFTHGDRRTAQDGRVTIGKAWLVSRLKALFQSDRIHLPPDHPEAQALTGELLDYEIRVDQNANDKYGAFKTGSHDDLVTALGLATQVVPASRAWIDEIITEWGMEFE
jgi:hypothetical protein